MFKFLLIKMCHQKLFYGWLIINAAFWADIYSLNKNFLLYREARCCQNTQNKCSPFGKKIHFSLGYLVPKKLCPALVFMHAQIKDCLKKGIVASAHTIAHLFLMVTCRAMTSITMYFIIDIKTCSHFHMCLWCLYWELQFLEKGPF